MALKRIVFICMCVLLAIALILTAVVVVKVLPILSALSGGQGQPPAVTTTPGTTTSQNTTTTTPPPITSTTPTLPPPPTTTQPPVTTEPGHVHNFQVSQVVQATCQSAGYTVYSCECGKTDIQDYVNAFGHDYGVGERVVFCDKEGYTRYVCRTCGYEDHRNPTEPLGHDFERDELKSKTPSCTRDGYDIMVCKRCLMEQKENEVMAPGHAWSDWVEIPAPGPGVAGQEERTCATCQEKETRPCQLEVTAGEQPLVTPDCHIYIVYVGSATTTDALRYEITDYSMATDMRFLYTEEGLSVIYTNKAGIPQHVLLDPLTNATLTIDINGNVDGGQDTPDNPTDPTDPTDSTGDGT